MKEKNVTTKISSFKELFDAAIKALIFSFIILCVFRFTIVDGQSMESTLYNDNKLILSKVSYLFDEPKQGDIVVVEPNAINVDYIIKRVIATPGDTVEIKNNIIYVNDVPLDEPYVKEQMVTADIEKFKLANDEYFICGDNRNNSLDSRSEILGPITEKEIFGKIIFNISTFKFY